MRKTETLRYFLYARKSSESEDRQMASIEDQKAEVKKIAEELNLNIIGVYSESKSAKAPGRKAFNEMLQRIEKGDADAILCWKLNRLARNPVDGGKVSWLLQNNIIKHIQCYGRDYKPTDNVLMMQVELGMANQFVKDLSTDVKRGMRQKAERGWNPFPTLPIGYVHNKTRKGLVKGKEIIKDKKRFPLVKKLWQMMLTGAYSIADIKREGDRLGLVNDANKPYVIHTYHKLFRTEFYCGYFYWRNADGVRQRYEGKHSPMISTQDFNRVQAFIGNHKRATRSKSYEFPFRGLLTCGECGCSITAERKFQVRCTGCRHKFSCLHRNDCPKCNMLISDMVAPTIIDRTYYRCTKRKGACSQKTVTETDLHQQYLERLQQIEIHEDFYKFMVREMEALAENENRNELLVIAQLKKQLSELQNRLDSLTLMRADGDIDKVQFLTMKTKTLGAIEDLELQIDTHEKSLTDWKGIAMGYLNFALKATKALEKTDIFTKKELLLKLGSNQRLMDKKLEFIRPKPLLASKSCNLVYEAQNETFEPEKSVINKGDLSNFELLMQACAQECKTFELAS